MDKWRGIAINFSKAEVVDKEVVDKLTRGEITGNVFPVDDQDDGRRRRPRRTEAPVRRRWDQADRRRPR